MQVTRANALSSKCSTISNVYSDSGRQTKYTDLITNKAVSIWPSYNWTSSMVAIMMTSSNGNISALLAICARNSPVAGEFPAQRPVTRSFDGFFFICVWINGWVNNREAGDLRRYRGHLDVIVMITRSLQTSDVSSVLIGRELSSYHLQACCKNGLFFLPGELMTLTARLGNVMTFVRDKKAWTQTYRVRHKNGQPGMHCLYQTPLLIMEISFAILFKEFVLSIELFQGR